MSSILLGDTVMQSGFYRDISLFYYINRELTLEEKEQLLLLEEEAAIRVVKTDFSFWQSGIRRHFCRDDNGEPEKNICISDHCDVLRYAKNAGWAVIACRDSILEEQEGRGEDTYFVSYVVEDLSAIDREYLETVYCHCKGIPRLIAVTDRLLIREMTLSDLDDLMEIFDGNEKTEFFEPFYDNREEAEQYLASYIRDVYRFYDFGIWGIYLKTSDGMIGIIGFTPRDEALELGYALAKAYQGKKYIAEAREAVIKYTREILGNFKIIEITNRSNGDKTI